VRTKRRYSPAGMSQPRQVQRASSFTLLNGCIMILRLQLETGHSPYRLQLLTNPPQFGHIFSSIFDSNLTNSKTISPGLRAFTRRPEICITQALQTRRNATARYRQAETATRNEFPLAIIQLTVEGCSTMPGF
jgi:hypothetical protein